VIEAKGRYMIPGLVRRAYGTFESGMLTTCGNLPAAVIPHAHVQMFTDPHENRPIVLGLEGVGI